MHSKDELKTCLANRIRILDTRMDEWMTALPSAVILSASVKQLLFFFVWHTGATHGILSCKGGQFASHFSM